jgi:plastocyanin
MNYKNILFIIIAFIIVGGLVMFFMSQNQSVPTMSDNTMMDDNTVTLQMAKDNQNSDQTEGMIQDQEIIVTASNFKFDQTTIKVKEGQTVKITFKNIEGTHDFVLDEFNVRTKIIKDSGEEKIEFVADKKGSFEYYCSVGSHRQMGMKGTLIVE